MDLIEYSCDREDGIPMVLEDLPVKLICTKQKLHITNLQPQSEVYACHYKFSNVIPISLISYSSRYRKLPPAHY